MRLIDPMTVYQLRQLGMTFRQIGVVMAVVNERRMAYAAPTVEKIYNGCFR